jgi:hypothetical protein
LRQLNQRGGTLIGQERIRQIEQGIGGTGEAFMIQIVPIDLQNGVVAQCRMIWYASMYRFNGKD